MKTPNENTVENKNNALENDSSSTPPNDVHGADDEFHLTIKKLEMPVRPRGVLAD